jgi:periplasmic protein TonB
MPPFFTPRLLCALFLLMKSAGGNFHPTSPHLGNSPTIPLRFSHFPTPTQFGTASLSLSGGGGDNDTRPAKRGDLAPLSSMPLMSPRRPQAQDPQLPVPPAVFDANAPVKVAVVTNLGSPGMKDDSDSAGRGKGHGIGDGNRNGMGDGNGDGEGEGGNGPYANLLSRVACQYCPEPPYTEEARKAKLQGSVTVQVPVGTDGRAQKMRILKGLDLGLDQQTLNTIRTWQFVPALDAHHKPVATWVTIETSFRLF